MYKYLPQRDWVVVAVKDNVAEAVLIGPECKNVMISDIVFFPKNCLVKHDTPEEHVFCVKESDIMVIKRNGE